MRTLQFHRSMKLGGRPSDPAKLNRELRLAQYLDAPTFSEFVPPVFRLYQDIPQFMDKNDELGDCVCACMAKMVRGWTQNATGTAVTITDQDVLDVYEKGAGYVPGKPYTDNGWTLIAQLAYWQKTGIAGHKIGAYASINPKNHFLMRSACFVFEGLDIALALPISAQGQAIWDASPGANGTPGSWGGHCVTIQGVDENDNPLIETWGYEQPCTWAFLDKYCTEAHAIISTEALKGDTVPISGINIAQLAADLKAVTS